MVQTSNITLDIVGVAFLIMKILRLFAALLIGSIFLIPRLLHTERLWKSKGSIEGVATAAFLERRALQPLSGFRPS
jgi:hypothetical protein